MPTYITIICAIAITTAIVTSIANRNSKYERLEAKLSGDIQKAEHIATISGMRISLMIMCTIITIGSFILFAV